jgi:putative copper export protein
MGGWPMISNGRGTRMLQAEPGFDWAHSLYELMEFVAVFLSLGAVGFRFASLRGRLPEGPGEPGTLQRLYADAGRRAAMIGLFGVALALTRFIIFLPRTAERAHTTVGGALTTLGRPMFTAIFLVVGVIGFALAVARLRPGWALALLGAVGPQLVNILSGRVGLMINSTHQLAGGVWIGSLFVMVLAGLAIALRGGPEREHGSLAVAEMVRGFSPMALAAASVLVGSGLVTAWRHLDGFGSLLTSAYGNALLVKLTLVAGVFSLGAWNWRRGIPRLNGADGPRAIQRSARAEALVAVLVILTTSVLVSFEAPAEAAETPAPSGGPVTR